ncbi:MAG: hypothetical protein AAF518_27750 [Spirochaetota bacterium]
MNAIASLTFTSSNWDTAQTVTVSAVDNSIVSGAVTSTIVHSITSSDSNYNGITVSDLTVSVSDNDSGTVTITESGTDTTAMEGYGNDTLSFVLTAEPVADVTVSISFDTTQVKVNSSTSSPVSLTFTSANWNTAQSVTVEAVDDGSIESAVHTSSLSYTTSSTVSTYDSLSLSTTSVNIIEDHGVQLASSFQSGSEDLSSSSTTVTLASTVNASTSFVYCNFQYSSSSNHNAVTCQLSSDGSSVEIQTGGGTSAKVNYYVAEFGSGTFVQRGTSNFSTTDTTKTVTLSSTVDTAKTMVLAYSRMTDTSNTYDERRFVKAVLTDGNTLTLSRGESGSEVDIEYQVIMMSSSTVQSGEVTLASGSTSVDASISSVDLTKSFLFFNYSGSSNINGVERSLYTRGYYNDSSTLRFERTNSSEDVYISYFAVSLSSGTDSIESGSTSVGSSDTSVNQAISTVDLDQSLVIISNDTTGAGSANQDSGTYYVETSSTNSQLTFSRYNQESNTATINWTVVDFSL